MVRFVGLDVHRRVVEACAVDDAGAVMLRRRFGLTRESLLDFARHVLQPEDHVIVEATLNTWAVVEVLEPHVAQVVVSNPLKTKAVAEARIKTDKVDAHTLAQLLRVDYVAEVWKPDETTQELRRLTRRRAGLVGDRTSAKNRIHSVLTRRLIQPPLQHLFGPSGLLWLRALELDDEGRMMIDSDLRVIESFDREIALLHDLLVKSAYADPRVHLLVTLPGVDLHVAVALLAALGDIGRFRSGAHAASYLGLVPRTKQSAHHCYRGPITKAGNTHARTMLVQACQTLGRNPGPLGVFFRRMKKKKCHNVAVIAAAHKLVTIAWHMLVNGEPYRYAMPAATEVKLARLRARATGKRRKPGMAKGQQAKPKLGPGQASRTINPLRRVYEKEELPPVRKPAPGEKAYLRRAGLAPFLEHINREHILPRKEAAK